MQLIERQRVSWNAVEARGKTRAEAPKPAGKQVGGEDSFLPIISAPWQYCCNAQASKVRDLREDLAAAEARAARLEESLAAGFAERSAMGEQLAAAEAARGAAAAERERTADQLSQVRARIRARVWFRVGVRVRVRVWDRCCSVLWNAGKVAAATSV